MLVTMAHESGCDPLGKYEKQEECFGRILSKAQDLTDSPGLSH